MAAPNDTLSQEILTVQEGTPTPESELCNPETLTKAD